MYRFTILCSSSLLFVLGVSCHKAAPTQPPVEITSHNFTWQLDRLGDGASNVISDVAIINDSLAYAVGVLYLNDSTGKLDPNPYNLAKWDGRRWNIQRLTYGGFSVPMKFVFAFNENDIWFGIGYLLHWNGSTFKEVEVPVFYGIGSNKMWGDASGKLYVVGNSGTIGYSPDHGSTWQKLSSGTTLDIKDIFAAVNPLNGSAEIIAVAGNPYVGSDRAILGISGTTVTGLATDGVDHALTGAWFMPGVDYWVVGGGMYEKKSWADRSWTQVPGTLTNDFTEAVRGNDWNDIFIVGDFGVVLHYNGVTWMNYVAETGINAGAYYSVAVRGNLVIAVGENPPHAVALVGKRIP